MHRIKSSIHVWFWAAYLVATQTHGISALELKKKLGIKRYATAFQILHKLRDTMLRPGRDKIGAEWPVELQQFPRPHRLHTSPTLHMLMAN